MKHITLLAAALLLMNGCSDEKKKELKQEASFNTVEYYKSHKELMELRIKECKLMESMTLIIEKDCRNAFKAKRLSQQNNINFKF